MEKIILFGAGKTVEYVISVMNRTDLFEIVEVWDNDEKKHGMQLAGAGEIRKPRAQDEFTIIVASIYFSEIKTGLMEEYGIREELIRPWNMEYFFQLIKEQIIQKYHESEDEEIQDILKFLEKEDLNTFNYPFKKYYEDVSIKMEYDDQKELFFTFWNGKKLYLCKKYDSKEMAEKYIRGLMIEQDINSPHYYGKIREYAKEGGVVVDAGAAEGIWALDVLDDVQKVILIECEPEWVEALQYTFEPYEEKVEIIPKPLVERENPNGITLTQLCRQESRIACIKMDIEGVEAGILQSEKELLETDAIENLLVCTYHNSSDAQEIRDVLCSTGYQTEFSRGYMFYIGSKILPELRRGIIRAKKCRGKGC